MTIYRQSVCPKEKKDTGTLASWSTATSDDLHMSADTQVGWVYPSSERERGSDSVNFRLGKLLGARIACTRKSVMEHNSSIENLGNLTLEHSVIATGICGIARYASSQRESARQRRVRTTSFSSPRLQKLGI